MKPTWHSHVYYVDIATGEKLKEKDALTNYHILKTDKYVRQFKPTESKRIIEYVKQCRRRTVKQGTLY